ncbi:hypothetical protein L313_2811 [Acinetobacter haemolyticus CIP 64.3 = MTCC 9819]|uniref:Methyl-coenzyme M reductase n=1 Tax=Acinetobacter haemolyticus CIP 64.3 = MTCC 9819 TaxID=1217659 RepID=N9EYL3_ACIHA|nr:hypothetical protein [Acinetobacter haemolyticus]ENW15628.1 hypothetical protein F927_03368 [Acinetobacter haemolyticus CIP 64.3 = MTCC 9819]EPR90401.1 hypothetical protein L313_2811 [Acinetobacter haemolyticus CIP 64.3 = MTCC 9819]QXZ26460.1 methyl-coenzyme M reductase [Acinetobacter haemolyticus]SPT48649.1 Uncharacterised protein [Acinetobacter haemolyticus]SUU61774.1 Uncharacterised protein [Acinetobacter haemolyticus]
MALIPRSLGRVGPQPTLQQQTPLTGLSDIGRSIGGVVQARDEQQREAEVTAKRLELFNNQMAEKEAKVKLDDTLTSEMSEQVTLLKNEVSNGSMKAQDANANLQEWSKARYGQLETELPDHAKQDLKQYWDSNISRQTTGFLPLQLRADVQKGAVLADRMTEIATRYDRAQGREYLNSNLQELNLSEADKQARIYSYESVRDSMDIDGRITDAVANKDTVDLQALVTDLDSGKYGYTDGKAAQQKKAQALSRIDAINKQIEVEENKRVTSAGKVLNDFKSQVLTGRALDESYLSNVGEAVKGTEYESEYNFYSQQSNNFQNFGRKTTSEQLALINAQKAKMKNSSTTDAVNEDKILNVYESIYKQKVDTLKNNPNQAVREAGLETQTLSALELSANPKSFAAKAIENGVNQIALKDPNITVKPISEEDLPEAKKAFDAMGVNEKLTFIGNMIDQSKGIPDGSKIWGATLGQLGGGDMNYVMAGVAKANKFSSTEGRDLATSIVSGTQLLKNKQMIMPKEDDLRLAFNDYVGQTLTGTSANNAYEVFKAVYADTMNARGFSHSAKDDSPNKGILHTALSMSTGGVYTQPSSYRNYMGEKGKDWKVTKPYAMKDDEFENRLDKGYSTISKQTGINSSDLKQLRLRQGKPAQSGDIQYDLINERGQPLVVDGAIWRIKMNGVVK